MSLSTYLCGFFLEELHLSVLKEREEARDDVLQEGGVLRRRCHILKFKVQDTLCHVVTLYVLQSCFSFSILIKDFSSLLQAYFTASKTYWFKSKKSLENYTFVESIKLLKIHHNTSKETLKMNPPPAHTVQRTFIKRTSKFSLTSCIIFSLVSSAAS